MNRVGIKATGLTLLDTLSRAGYTIRNRKQRIPWQGSHGLEYADSEIRTINCIVALRLISGRPYLFRNKLKRHTASLLEKLQKYGEPAKPQPIERIHIDDIDLDTFWNNFVFNPQPVVITGFKAPAFDWTMDWFFSKYGQEKSTLFNLKTGDIEELPIDTVINKPGEYYYANSEQIWRDHPELLNGLDIPALSRLAKHHLHFATNSFLKTGKGRGVFLHNDGTVATFFLMLQGCKQWRVVDPYFAPLVYPILRPHDVYTAVEFMDESEHAHLPLLKYCPYYDTVLEEGEIIWNPTYFFHSVDNLTDKTMAISTRWYAWPGKNTMDPWPTQSKATVLSLAKFISNVEATKHVLDNGTPFNWYDSISHGRAYPMSRTDVMKVWGIKPVPQVLR